MADTTRVEQLEAELRRLRELRAADQHEIEDLRQRATTLAGNLAEARDQQTATAGILRVIASPSAELSHVFDAVAE